ncbi:hypothetical protein [Thalassotalea sp. G2M2-11]|nr:hypothetical protein [Thalassotalea sp. G2M2-11]
MRPRHTITKDGENVENAWSIFRPYFLYIKSPCIGKGLVITYIEQ